MVKLFPCSSVRSVLSDRKRSNCVSLCLRITQISSAVRGELAGAGLGVGRKCLSEILK